VDVYVNEGFVPPAPGPAELRLYSVSRSQLRPPIGATDEQGTDWLPALRARDGRYVAPLTLTRYQGIATLHDLILDFGDLSGLDSVHLFLNGWIFPTDASINLALAQRVRPASFSLPRGEGCAGPLEQGRRRGLPVGEEQDGDRGSHGKVLERRSPRAPADQHGDLLGPGVRRRWRSR